MTDKEALEMLQEERLMTFYRFPALNEAVLKAIEALEKQIPKKPTIKKSCKVNAFTLRCPNCEAVLQADSPCCRYCGQALDWSDMK